MSFPLSVRETGEWKRRKRMQRRKGGGREGSPVLNVITWYQVLLFCQSKWSRMIDFRDGSETYPISPVDLKC